MKINKFFLLFANCVLVRGAARSTVCDFQRGLYIFVPNPVADLLVELENQTIEDTLKKKPGLKKKILYSYFDYLSKNDFGHFCSNRMNFPKLDTTFQKPNKIEDCIIELSDLTYQNMEFIIKSLTRLGCKTLEIRAFQSFPLKKISTVIDLLKDSPIKNLELFLKYSDKISPIAYDKFMKQNQIIGSLVVHSINHNLRNNFNSKVFFTNQTLANSNCCGSISKENFMINTEFYLEGLKYNTCLNRKVSVTKDGVIKNCPSLKENYGNINNTSIENAIKKPGFSKFWNINKDRIEVCKDCEFRYVCSDCRANIEGDYSKPKSCKYDPYAMSYSG